MYSSARILVTTSRFPFAVDEIRKLGALGHVVHAGDTFAEAPGNHSRYAEACLQYPPPRQAPVDFVRYVGFWCREHGIDVVLPTFEESLYLARYAEYLPKHVRLAAPDLKAALRLHDKGSFLQLADDLDLPVPDTRLVTSHHEMHRAIDEFGQYFARPTRSRGGLDILTNHGAEDHDAVQQAQIDDSRPWVVQPFVEGDEICTFSVARAGRLVAHVTYRHPRSLAGGGGISFESIECEEAVICAGKIAAETGYDGQFGLDLIDGPDGLVLAECNPRGTAGVGLLPAEQFERGLFASGDDGLFVTPAGRQCHITTGLLLDTLQDGSHLWSNLKAMFGAGNDLYGRSDDMSPALYAFFSLSHVRDYRQQMRDEAQGDWSDVVRAQFFDVSWD